MIHGLLVSYVIMGDAGCIPIFSKVSNLSSYDMVTDAAGTPEYRDSRGQADP